MAEGQIHTGGFLLGTLRIRNWTKYQHYKAKRPAWVKWYRETTNNLGWLGMGDEGKLLLPYLLLVAAETENQIPDDPEILSLRLRLKPSTVRKGIDSMLNSGFLQNMHTDADDASVCMPNARARTRSVSVSPSVSEKGESKPKRKPDPLWDAFAEEVGSQPATTSERGAWNKALKELRAADATAEQVHARCTEYRSRFSGAALTLPALAKHWGALSKSQSKPKDRRPAPSKPLPPPIPRDEYADSIWQAALAAIKPGIDPHTFSTWLRPTYGAGIDGGTLRVAVPTDTHRDWIAEHHAEQAAAATGKTIELVSRETAWTNREAQSA